MMWILFLNDMRAAHSEDLTAVGWAATRETLEAVLASEKVEPYTDDRWNKVFRRGGPLEWCNAPWTSDIEEGATFREVPPTIVIAGCVVYSNPEPTCPPLTGLP